MKSTKWMLYAALFYLTAAAQAETIKTPVLLLSQRLEGSSSWSLSIECDKNTPTKPERLVFETLPGVNLATSKYNTVLTMHRDLNSVREPLSTLSAANFGVKNLEFDDKILTLGVVATDKGLRLDLKARISMDGFAAIGDQPNSYGTVYLKFCPDCQQWKIWVESLTGTNGNRLTDTILTSIVFLSGKTMVSLILAVDEQGKPTKLLDK